MAPSSIDRPWAAPAEPWALAMRWSDLLFAHWPIDAALLRDKVPAGLELDRFDGSAWIGVVPFRMSAVRPAGAPALPLLSSFPELNVRTYVTRDGKPGVWFLSLDAASRLTVIGARAAFLLPYFFARMSCRPIGRTRSDATLDDAWIEYTSERVDRRGPAAEFRARYRPIGPTQHARAGTLDHFLTARFCLYAADPRRDARGPLFRGEIDHAPWPLQRAQLELERNTMFAAHGLPTLETSASLPIVHFARRLDVAAWPIAPVD